MMMTTKVAGRGSNEDNDGQEAGGAAATGIMMMLVG